jgi:hypothetical protein
MRMPEKKLLRKPWDLRDEIKRGWRKFLNGLLNYYSPLNKTRCGVQDMLLSWEDEKHNISMRKPQEKRPLHTLGCGWEKWTGFSQSKMGVQVGFL